MKRFIIVLASVALVIFAIVAIFLSTQSAQDMVLMATQPRLTRIPAPIVDYWIKHFSRLSGIDQGAYPVTLLQFDLNGYEGFDRPTTIEEKARVLEIANLILNRGHDINAIDSMGLTSVHYTVVNRSPETLEFLITHGANVNKPSSKGKRLTPLAFAHRYQSKLLHPEEKGSYEPVISLLISNGAHE